MKRAIRAIAALCLALGFAAAAQAQTIPPSTLQTQVNALPWTNGQGSLTGAEMQALWNTAISVFTTWAAPLSSPVFTNGLSLSTGVFGIPQATWTDTQTCTPGQISVDASYIYVCTSTNVVKRAALSSF